MGENSKIGPREAQLRAMREARALEAERQNAATKVKAKGIGKLHQTKIAKRGRTGR